MPQEVERIVLVRRYTTLVGTAPFHTKPRNIRRFASANVVAWAGEGTGTNPEIMIQIQESSDLNIWRNVGGAFSPSAGEATGQREFTLPWMRLLMFLTGTDPAMSCWVIGEFVVRGT